MIDPKSAEIAEELALDQQPDTEDDTNVPVSTGDAGDPKTQKAQERKARKREREAREFWTAVLGTEIGRREIWSILEATHAFEIRFGTGPNGFPSHDASVAYMAEQQLGQRIFISLQRLDKDGVFLMMEEYDPRLAKPKGRK